MDEYATEFREKFGRRIHIGDIVQYRLYTKHSGPLNFRVVRFGKHVNIVPAHITDPNIGGWRLTHKMTKFTVVVETDFMKR